MTQYHYLDDSGDPGLDGSPGSSSHFALAMVQLPVREPLPELARVRQTLHLPRTLEFKHYTARPHQKEAFFQAIQRVPFRVRAVVVEKAGLSGQFARLNGQDLTVEFLARLILRASELDIASDVLIIDGAATVFCRALRVRLSAECRRLDRVRPFAKIVGSKSRNEDGLQLADMIAGAVRQYVMGEGGDYYQTFEKKVTDLWVVTGRRQ